MNIEKEILKLAKQMPEEVAYAAECVRSITDPNYRQTVKDIFLIYFDKFRPKNYDVYNFIVACQLSKSQAKELAETNQQLE